MEPRVLALGRARPHMGPVTPHGLPRAAEELP